MKKVFTTGQVAKICQVSPRTVSKWFDSGRLRGYRIPGSQDRRIPREAFIRFLKENGMPLGPFEDFSCRRVLLVGCSPDFVRLAMEVIPESEDYLIRSAATLFDAGHAASGYEPHLVVLDLSIGRGDAICAAKRLRDMIGGTKLVALAAEDATDCLAWFDAVHKRPFDARAVLSSVRDLIDSLEVEA